MCKSSFKPLVEGHSFFCSWASHCSRICVFLAVGRTLPEIFLLARWLNHIAALARNPGEQWGRAQVCTEVRIGRGWGGLPLFQDSQTVHFGHAEQLGDLWQTKAAKKYRKPSARYATHLGIHGAEGHSRAPSDCSLVSAKESCKNDFL